MKKNNRVDVTGLDTKVRPQDDYFAYANGGWIAANPIPPQESRWGSFTKLRYDVEQKLHRILMELLEKKSLPAGSPERMLHDFFAAGMNMKQRNAAGLSPLQGILASVSKAKTKEDIAKLLPKLHSMGLGVFFGAGVDQDSKQSTKYILHFFQSGLGMPDRDYYLKDDAESVRVRDAYTKHVAAVFKLMGRDKKEVQTLTEGLLALETAIARISMTKEDRRDAEKVYHKKSIKQLQTLAPYLSWKEYCKAIGAKDITQVIVMQPQFFAGLGKILATTPLETIQSYIAWHIVNDYSGYLSDPFIKQSFSFYSVTLAGTKTMKPLWRRVLGATSASLGDLLGRLFVEKHFDVRAKKIMDHMVQDLFTAYEARIRALDWMSPATKKKALLKLKAMNPKIGYPKKWRSYKGLVVKADDYACNAMRSAAFEFKRNLKKLGKALDRDEWHMNAHTVNAYFAPNLNDIVFPAGILQPPFFSPDAHPAQNYGAIGSVIGHEITHGFDDDGSKFDHHGNMKEWWTKEDRARFMKKAKKIEKQFDQYTVADGIKVNGRLTLGENIADLGGVSIALDAYHLRYGKDTEKDPDGFTAIERFFLGFALFEREHCRPEVEKLMVLTDPHSPAKFRINGTLTNVQEFYDAYSLKEKDGLYRAPKDRTKIW